MSDWYKDVEARIGRALKAIQRDNVPKIVSYAKLYNIPYQHLYYRVNGRPSRSTRLPAGKKLDSIQEKALIDYIDRIDKLFMSVIIPLI